MTYFVINPRGKSGGYHVIVASSPLDDTLQRGRLGGSGSEKELRLEIRLKR